MSGDFWGSPPGAPLSDRCSSVRGGAKCDGTTGRLRPWQLRGAERRADRWGQACPPLRRQTQAWGQSAATASSGSGSFMMLQSSYQPRRSEGFSEARGCTPKLTSMAADRPQKIHLQGHSQRGISSPLQGPFQRLSEVSHNRAAHVPLLKATS